MIKNITLLLTILACHQIAFSYQEIEEMSTDEKEIIILAANPQEKKILKEFLTAPQGNIDIEKVRSILKRMLHEAKVSQPMMTLNQQGD